MGPDLFYRCGFYRWNYFKRFIERQLMSFRDRQQISNNSKLLNGLRENFLNRICLQEQEAIFKEFHNKVLQWLGSGSVEAENDRRLTSANWLTIT